MTPERLMLVTKMVMLAIEGTHACTKHGTKPDDFEDFEKRACDYGCYFSVTREEVREVLAMTFGDLAKKVSTA
jgi:hypothetical protein